MRQEFRKFLYQIILGFSVIVFMVPSAYSVSPDEVLKDPKLEKRARKLSLNLRCLVCQNQSIDDSDAPLAKDLRLLVRERLLAGDTDEQVIEFIVNRYGEFVLLKPRFNSGTLLLWLSPILLLLIALFIIMRSYLQSKVKPPKTEQLSEAEKQELEKILKG